MTQTVYAYMHKIKIKKKTSKLLTWVDLGINQVRHPLTGLFSFLVLVICDMFYISFPSLDYEQCKTGMLCLLVIYY
jgi:hypothetical protein